MRCYPDLTDDEKQQALLIETGDVLRCLAEFPEDFADEVTDAVADCWTEAERLQTPWFIGEIIMENKLLHQEVADNARLNVERAWYPDANEHVIHLRKTG